MICRDARIARCLLALLLVMSPACSAEVRAGSSFQGGAFEPPRPAPDFMLQATDGTEFRLSQQQGKVLVLGFGYTFCPDVCPTTLAELAQVRYNLGAAAQRLQIAYITVDPERDTPERLRVYTQAFDPAFLGLTGTAEQLAQVQKAYGVLVERRVVAGTAAAYLVHHTASVYVIDAAGRLRLMFPFPIPVEAMTHDLKLLLKE